MAPPHKNPEEIPVAALIAPDIIALLEESPSDIRVETEEIHPADLAGVAELLDSDQLKAFLAALGPVRGGEILGYLDVDVRTEFLEAITPQQAAELVTQMTPDDRADTLDEIDEEHAEEILSEIPTAAREETQKLLSYEPDSAGGLMTTEVVSVAENMTVEAALENVRMVARSGRKEAMNTIYTTDTQGRVVGVMSLRELLAAPPGAKINDIAWSEVVSVSPTADREEVARVIANYDLLAVPVVSESGHVMGVVTVDDVIDAIQEEQTEDVQKLGGLEALDEPYMQVSILGMLKKRAGWLSILMISEMFTTSALQHFDVELQKLPVLELFVPLVMSSGGNSGSQATSLITRAMALKEVKLVDWWRVAVRELPSGIALGAILGVIGVIRIIIWQKFGFYDYGKGGVPYQQVAATIFCALIGIVTFGSLAGSMLPFILRRLGFDPASASAPFVATLVDVTGLVIYFTVALAVLGRFMV